MELIDDCGGYSKVFYDTQNHLCIKKIHTNDNQDDILFKYKILEDITRLRYDNRHLINVYDYYTIPDFLIIKMEYFGMDLFDSVKHVRSKDMIFSILSQIMVAFNTMASYGFYYTDLKHENVLCVFNGPNVRIKLCDLESFYNPNIDKSRIYFSTKYIKPPYEENTSIPIFDEKFTVWTLGIFLLLSLNWDIMDDIFYSKSDETKREHYEEFLRTYTLFYSKKTKYETKRRIDEVVYISPDDHHSIINSSFILKMLTCKKDRCTFDYINKKLKKIKF